LFREKRFRFGQLDLGRSANADCIVIPTGTRKMRATSHAFKENSRRALADPDLRRALHKLKIGFPRRRVAAIARLPEFEQMRDAARDMKNDVIEHLDEYLERFERQVSAHGGQVHWARDAERARDVVLEICQAVGARKVIKGKSMISEEIALNDHLQAHGIEPLETDLGEYIVQLRGETPSHILAPAVHVNVEEVAETFFREHSKHGKTRLLGEPRELMDEARRVLRQAFLSADVGITGANFCIAETGTTVIVTNEGNGDLTQILPDVHIVLASVEKIVPTMDDAMLLHRLLARSATGQESEVYTTFSTGPRRPGDLDGPTQFHVVLLDNGRSDMIGTEFQDMLRCIRCSACLNHCPVYAAVGGHAYGWVYPGPMGSVLTPHFLGVEQAGHLPNASTFCGRCESVCPLRIPLPKLLRYWRQQEFEKHLQPRPVRFGLGLWAYLAKRPKLYRQVVGLVTRALSAVGKRSGLIRQLPLGSGWSAWRDLPAPQGSSFQQQWAVSRDR